MSRATYPWKLAHPGEGRVSLHPWIAAAVAEKVGAVETAIEFFNKRAGKTRGDRLIEFLRNAPAARPEPADEVR